jgi:CRP-like cAMP-binding protein
MATARSSHDPSANRPPPRDGNLLLAALPPSDYDRIVTPLEVVPLRLKQILHQPGTPIRDVYFPDAGFVSELAVLSDGRMVEVATIGREGVVGAFGDSGTGPVTSASMVQAATSTSVKMPAASFKREMDQRGAFYELVSRYRFALVRFIMQSTACNAVHTVEERLARWLLTAEDHLRSNVFPLTQEFVAMMLGVTRPTVSEVAGTLQRAGLITYRRGFVTIVDHERLQTAACECYGITAAIVDTLRGDAPRGQRFRRAATS